MDIFGPTESKGFRSISEVNRRPQSYPLMTPSSPPRITSLPATESGKQRCVMRWNGGDGDPGQSSHSEWRAGDVTRRPAPEGERQTSSSSHQHHHYRPKRQKPKSILPRVNYLTSSDSYPNASRSMTRRAAKPPGSTVAASARGRPAAPHRAPPP